jgi:selenide,water dikinase
VRQLAGFFPATEYPDVLIGLGEPDDAAVFRLDDARALIQTTDFFTPVVDDPWTFGAIAAANAMSDVYAMGGDVVLALNIAGFGEDVPPATVTQIFAGGAYKVREAGAAIAGGHTVTAPEPFYGLSVTGVVHPQQVMRKGGAQPGDLLYLTKPLGAGVITTAAKLAGDYEGALRRWVRQLRKRPSLDVRHLDAAIDSMLRLNREAALAARAAQVRSATDITGFGLLGHATEMALASGAAFVIRAEAAPVLPGVWDYIAAGYLTRGHVRNPQYFGRHVTFAADVPQPQRILLWEAETSGGLLLAVPPAQAEHFRAICQANQQPYWEVGSVQAGAGVQVV